MWPGRRDAGERGRSRQPRHQLQQDQDEQDGTTPLNGEDHDNRGHQLQQDQDEQDGTVSTEHGQAETICARRSVSLKGTEIGRQPAPARMTFITWAEGANLCVTLYMSSWQDLLG